jgi:hypothetical protein
MKHIASFVCLSAYVLVACSGASTTPTGAAPAGADTSSDEAITEASCHSFKDCPDNQSASGDVIAECADDVRNEACPAICKNKKCAANPNLATGSSSGPASAVDTTFTCTAHVSAGEPEGGPITLHLKGGDADVHFEPNGNTVSGKLNPDYRPTSAANRIYAQFRSFPFDAECGAETTLLAEKTMLAGAKGKAKFGAPGERCNYALYSCTPK